MKVYMITKRMGTDSETWLGPCNYGSMPEAMDAASVCLASHPAWTVNIIELDIDPDAAMQSCEATQLTAFGEPQICADRREIDVARKG